MVDHAGDMEEPGGPGPGVVDHGGFSRGFGSGFLVWGHGPHSGKAKDKEWLPVTKLGHVAKDMKIKSLKKNCLFSLPIKESEIIDFFLRTSLKDEVLKIIPVEKQTWASQQTRFKVTNDYDSALVYLIPSPRGISMVVPLPKKLLLTIDDCYKLTRGCTPGNFVKATFSAISKTNSYLTPDLEKRLCSPSLLPGTEHLVKAHIRASIQKSQAPAVATT
uniref:Small ribosomal subunit protein uS5 n=1 Tax=Loxodonta africana TaxID=9785 RepID=G3U7W4_LOXAF